MAPVSNHLNVNVNLDGRSRLINVFESCLMTGLMESIVILPSGISSDQPDRL